MSQQQPEVVQFEIKFTRFLAANGEIERDLPEFAKDIELLHRLYRMMCFTRTFDKKAIALQRTGKLGTYPSTLGQEAICVGIGAAMQEDDVLCPYYREYGAQFWRGVTPEEILLYWGGDETGSAFKNNKEDFPICVPIASQNLHAVGVATAFKLRNQPRVAVTTVGDGGTSRGDFYEAINVAGAWNLPAVFVINNNQWAISVPRDKQCGAETLAQKAIAAGVRGLQVDGNDIFSVKDAVANALLTARTGGGPTVIEALTYRMCDHTTADDASRYRSEQELAEHKAEDPVLRFKNYLMAIGEWDEERDQVMQQELTDEVNAAADNYLNAPQPKPESMFDYLYEKLPEAYQSQRDEVIGGGK